MKEKEEMCKEETRTIENHNVSSSTLLQSSITEKEEKTGIFPWPKASTRDVEVFEDVFQLFHEKLTPLLLLSLSFASGSNSKPFLQLFDKEISQETCNNDNLEEILKKINYSFKESASFLELSHYYKQNRVEEENIEFNSPISLFVFISCASTPNLYLNIVGQSVLPVN